MRKNQKYANSLMARFHKKLAAKKQWNIDQLAEAMQQCAYKAQASKGEKNARRATDDYVIDMLYGRRAMPHRWQIAAANVLEMTFSDYEQQMPKALQENFSAPTKEEILPINFWPHFEWRSEFTQPRKIAARLYGLSKNGITPSFSIIPGQWQPPVGFSDYANLRNEAWQELVSNYSRMKKEPPNPKSAWHVRNIAAADNSTIALEIIQADYRDIMVTATQQGLEHAVQTSLGTKCTVRQWLAASWEAGNPSEPVLPSSRHLVVNLMIVTKGGSVVLSRQGPDSPESAGSWATSVSTVVNPKTDCDSSVMPDLARAASRGCKEELNMETDGTSVRWLTLAAGFKFGSHTFFGLLETPWSKREIQTAVAQNIERAKRYSTRVCQVVEVDFLELSPKAVAQRLRSHDYRPYLELGLALLLWRNGDAEITEGIQTPFSNKKPGQS
jgi:hypothetical protein